MKPMSDDPSTQAQAPDNVVQLTPMNTAPINTGTPSIISIPPQIATTLVWVAVGFAIGVWICNRSKSKLF